MSTLIPEPDSEPQPAGETAPIDKLQGELEEAFPPGAPPPDPEQTADGGGMIDESMMRMFLAVPFDFLAARKGDHWKLQPDELAALLPVAVKVSNKYAPDMLKRWGDEIGLAVVLGMILMKRVNLDSEIEAQKAAEKAPAAA